MLSNAPISILILDHYELGWPFNDNFHLIILLYVLHVCVNGVSICIYMAIPFIIDTLFIVSMESACAGAWPDLLLEDVRELFCGLYRYQTLR